MLTPSGASAIDLLAEQNSWASEREQLTGEVRDAIITAFDAGISAGNLDEADQLLKAVLEIGADGSTVDEMSAMLDGACIEIEQERITNVSEMTLRKRVAPRFPNSTRSWRVMGRGLLHGGH